MNETPDLLACSGVRFGYPTKPDFLGPIDLTLHTGGLLAIVGPNGAGKSTLLRLLCGLLRPSAGVVALAGQDLHRLAPRRRAEQIAFVPQRPTAPDDVTVRQIVLLGRYPHQGWQYFDSAGDHRIAEQALAETETQVFADRPLSTLSVGEQQRVFLAAAMAQQPRLLVLDEPTAALDPYHQLTLFTLLKHKAATLRMTIAVVLHDLNLAGRYADRLLLLSDGRAAAVGSPREVLVESVLQSVYHVRFHVSSNGRRWIEPDEPLAGSA